MGLGSGITDVEFALLVIKMARKTFKEAGHYPKPTPEMDPEWVRMVSVLGGNLMYLEQVAIDYIEAHGNDEQRKELITIMYRME